MQLPTNELYVKKTYRADKAEKPKDKNKETKNSSFKKILDKKKEQADSENPQEKKNTSPNPLQTAPLSLFTLVETSHAENTKAIRSACQVLFDTMADQITHQAKNGISTTTVTVGGDSIFAGCEIEIKSYDTAPLSFLIELRGSANAQAIFTKNIGTLSSQLASVFKEYQIDLRAPKLHESKGQKRGHGSSHFTAKRKNTRQIGKIV